MKVFSVIVMFTMLSFAAVGEITVVKGDAYIQRDVELIKAHKKMPLLQADIAKTKSGRLQMLFIDNTVISIGKNSLFKIQEYFYEEQNKKTVAVFELKSGYAKAITGKIGKSGPHAFIMKTPSSIIKPHGTVWSVDIKKNTETFNVHEGSISISFNDGSQKLVTLGAGSSIILHKDPKNSTKVVKSIKGVNASKLKGDNRRIPPKGGRTFENPRKPERPTLPTLPTLPDVVPG